MVLVDGAEITKPVVTCVSRPKLRWCWKDLTSNHILDIINAVDYILPAFEVCDSRVTGWNVKSCDFVADNAAACLVVLGTKPVYLSDCDITRSEMVTRRGEEVVSQGKATAILGHPLHALKWLADDLVRIGKPLRAVNL
jgi:2-keto-4-pentenoate hydratase